MSKKRLRQAWPAAPPSPPLSWALALLILGWWGHLLQASPACGPPDQGRMEELQDRAGIIQTPNFPRPFPTPITCQWLVNSSSYPNSIIVIYFTQLYVLDGIKMKEWADYHTGMGEKELKIPEQYNILAYMASPNPYMLLKFEARGLENHFRSSYSFLDVYGFNITYQIVDVDTYHHHSLTNCSVIGCSAAGHCFASSDFSRYECSCLENFLGEKCQYGPSCNPEKNITKCKNGGTCMYVGEKALRCSCPPGYKGPTCEIEESHIKACPRKTLESTGPPCNCRHSAALAHKVRYEGFIKVINASMEPTHEFQPSPLPPPIPPNASNTTVPVLHLISQKLKEYYRSYEVDVIDHFAILSVREGSEVMYHFFGDQKEEHNSTKAFTDLQYHKQLGNFTLGLKMTLDIQRPLYIESVKVNREFPLKQGEEFSLTCVATGSDYIQFRWFKDGKPIDKSKGLRDILQIRLPKNSKDQLSEVLVVPKATMTDQGVFVCQVSDFLQLQCRDIYVEVQSLPTVCLTPLSATVPKGGSVNVTCKASNDHLAEIYGYTWKKNMDTKMGDNEIIEDLYPMGSILKIINAQGSANYTCEAGGKMGSGRQWLWVKVADLSQVKTCLQKEAWNITWPMTAVNQLARIHCPEPYKGIASRKCTYMTGNTVGWDVPDLSDCLSPEVKDIRNDFEQLTEGYAATTPAKVLKQSDEFLRGRVQMYPGEGETVLELFRRVYRYMMKKKMQKELADSVYDYFGALGAILNQNHSIRNREQLPNMQWCIEKFSLTFAAAQPFDKPFRTNSVSLVLETVRFMVTYEHIMSPSRTHSIYPSWFQDEIHLRLASSRIAAFRDNSSYVIVVYRSLHEMMPQRYVGQTGKDVEVMYEVNSHVVSVWRGGADGSLGSGGGEEVILTLKHLKQYPERNWRVTCGRANRTSSGAATWGLAACVPTAMLNATRCNCQGPGTYALLQVTNTVPPVENETDLHNDTVVLIGCMSCLLMTLLVVAVLLCHWRMHRHYLFYLKIQFCFSIIGSMTLFLCAGQNLIPKNFYPYSCVFLEAFVLLAMASQFSQLLLVYNEVIQFPWTRHVKQLAIISIVTALPLMPLAATAFAHKTMRWRLSGWWLLLDNRGFFVSFLVSAGILLTFFLTIYWLTMAKLRAMAHESNASAQNLLVQKRVGLVRRSAAIFTCCLIMTASSILYVNIPSEKSQYLFCISCALLGVITLLLYTVKSETPIPRGLASRLRIIKTDECEPEPLNSLKCYGNTEGSATESNRDFRESHRLLHSHSHPPHPHSHPAPYQEKSPPQSMVPFVISTNPSTQETLLVHSIQGSAESKSMAAATSSLDQDEDDTSEWTKEKPCMGPDPPSPFSSVTLEKYNSSPRKFQHKEMKEGAEEEAEEEGAKVESEGPRPIRGKCLIQRPVCPPTVEEDTYIPMGGVLEEDVPIPSPPPEFAASTPSPPAPSIPLPPHLHHAIPPRVQHLPSSSSSSSVSQTHSQSSDRTLSQISSDLSYLLGNRSSSSSSGQQPPRTKPPQKVHINEDHNVIIGAQSPHK